MARQKFWFVVGDVACGKIASNVLDAWLSVEIAGGKHGAEFTEGTGHLIEAYDSECTLLASRTWEQWHSEVLRDTYGDAWREHCDNAAKLMR